MIRLRKPSYCYCLCRWLLSAAYTPTMKVTFSLGVCYTSEDREINTIQWESTSNWLQLIWQVPCNAAKAMEMREGKTCALKWSLESSVSCREQMKNARYVFPKQSFGAERTWKEKEKSPVSTKLHILKTNVRRTIHVSVVLEPLVVGKCL